MKRWPVAAAGTVYHVGLLNPKAKGKDSLEGAGLSVSLVPGVWVRIAQLGGLPWWKLSRRGSSFLLYHKLTKKQREEIAKWGVELGFVKLGAAYKLTHTDEDGGESYSVYIDPNEAKTEADGMEPSWHPTIEEVQVLHPTSKMSQRVGVKTNVMTSHDHLTTIFAEDALGIDGVWWSDDLDEDALSAPRGVIVPSMVSKWKAREIEPDEDQR
jgi:hypothetical protein